MKLHGPADPDQFRVKVGYYRHYFDNLPACDIAPATDATWPAVSSIKNAAGKDWSYTTMGRIAADLAADPGKHVGKAEQAIYNDLVALNKTELSRAQDRGTEVHELLEAKAFGGDTFLKPDAEKYRPVVDQFLADCQPEIFLSEVVVINRTLGYGGSGDAWVVINHPDFGRLLVDWKTRGSAEKHNAYPEECWQVGGGYFHGEYMIVEEDGQAKRAPMPPLDGAAIVSLAPESYKIFPIEVEDSWETFQRLYEFWASKAEKVFHGKPLYVRRATPASVDADEVARLQKSAEWIRDNSPKGLELLAARWPDGVPTFKAGGPQNADQASALAMVLTAVLKDAGVPFEPDPDPEPQPEPEPAAAVVTASAPDEGPDVTTVRYAELEANLAELPTACRQWIEAIAAQAHKAKGSISLRQKPSTRRYEIVRGLILIAPKAGDETVNAIAAAATDDDQLLAASVTAGAALATLDAAQAATFAHLCEAYATGHRLAVADETGVLRLSAA